MFKVGKTVPISNNTDLDCQVGILSSVDLFKLTDCFGSNIILNKWEIKRLYNLVQEIELEKNCDCKGVKNV